MMTKKTENLDELKRLVGPDTERLKVEHPNLAELLQAYRKDWKAFREAVGGKTATGSARGRRYSA